MDTSAVRVDLRSDGSVKTCHTSHRLRDSLCKGKFARPVWHPVTSTVMDTLTFALWISAVRRSGCLVLLKEARVNFRDEKKYCHSRPLAEEASVVHSNP